MTATACYSNAGEKTMPVKVTIECLSAVGCYGELSEAKRRVMPSDGIFVSDYEIMLEEDATCYEALLQVCDEFGLHIDHISLPGTEYIKGLGNLYEFDLGAESGWLYSVNGEKPGTGANNVKLKNGDSMRWFYSVTNEEEKENQNTLLNINESKGK